MGFRELVGLVQRTALRVFGEPDPVLLVPASGAPAYQLAHGGIFRDAHVGVDVESEVEISSRNPVLHVLAADLAAELVEGDRVTVRGSTYYVGEPEADGEGILRLELLEAPSP